MHHGLPLAVGPPNLLEPHSALLRRKQGIVFAYSDVLAFPVKRSPLSQNDVPRDDGLLIPLLEAQTLAGRAAFVLNRTTCLLGGLADLQRKKPCAGV